MYGRYLFDGAGGCSWINNDGAGGQPVICADWGPWPSKTGITGVDDIGDILDE